jgi:pSer/pThr/pTyr-binding forkhead associated (FHA) protein
MAGPKLQLLFEGKLVAEAPFLGAPLRIGRLKGNDVVINNLSTSRFHATLTEQNGGWMLEDLGSENGSWVNGRRIETCRVGPGDRIQIGKHDIVIVPADAAPARAEAPELTESEPELTDPVPARAADAAPMDLVPLESDAELAAPEPMEELSAAGGDLFGAAGTPGGSSDLSGYDVSESDLQIPAAEPPAIETPTVLIADTNEATQMRAPAKPATAADPAGLLEELDAAEPPAPAPEPEPLHAGIILQRDGRLERVIQWELDRMTLGRAAECEIVLATPEISRRHALLVREGDHYEVRDLESINGTHVNGEKVARRELKSGDVIRIEDFEMTFVIDRGPISGHVKTAARPTAAPGAARDPGVTQFGEMMDLAPFVAKESEEDDANAMSFDNLGSPLENGELPPIPMPGASPAPAPLEAVADEPPLETDAPLEADAPAEALIEMPEGLDLAEGLDMPETLEATELLEEELPAAAPVRAEPPAPEPEPDTVLLSDDDAEEKDLVEAPREARTLRLELRIRLEELPQPLRDALSALDPADLRLPVELRLATEE